MTSRSTYAFTDGDLNGPADPDVVAALSGEFGVILPLDYSEFLLSHNGGEGFVNENYLVLWRAEELVEFNREYEVVEYATGLILFGSNGGGEGYGFDTLYPTLPVVRVPFIGMDREFVEQVAEHFADLFLTSSN